MKKNIKKELCVYIYIYIYIYIYNWITVLYRTVLHRRNKCNIVNQLYFNKNNDKKQKNIVPVFRHGHGSG